MKTLIVIELLLIPVVSIAYFNGPYTGVNQATQAIVQYETVNTPSQSGPNIEIQKFYDYDEKVICYVYVDKGITCVNDNTN